MCPVCRKAGKSRGPSSYLLFPSDTKQLCIPCATLVRGNREVPLLLERPCERVAQQLVLKWGL